jgi:alkaline phosphatase D
MSRFPFGVASGDPQADRIVLWTRVEVGRRGPIRWLVASDPDIHDLVGTGDVVPRPADDGSVSVDVDGLEPGTRYWYAFEADGQRSTVGRFRTLPGPGARHLRFAVVSCAKFNAGYFNGYARIAERDDLDFVLHLGDYIYEAAETPPASQTPGADIGRPFDPLNECRTLDDYRRRYAQYRGDPDTQAIHHAHALIGTVDDHEFADGAWHGGADEHRDERDGPWAERMAAAFRVRHEWLPMRLPDAARPDRIFRSFRMGDLVELFVIDIRSRRDAPARGERMHDPTRSQLGAEQRDWLFEGLDASAATWQLLGNASVLSRTWVEAPSPKLLAGLQALKMMSPDAGPDPDQWDGYPVEREALLGHVAGRDVVILSGDVHVGMDLDLRRAADPDRVVAREFVTASLTSQNLDDKKRWGYRTESVAVEAEMMAALPDVRWLDFDSHGYMLVDVTPERVRVEWWFVDTVLERVPGQRLAHAVEVPVTRQAMASAG